ncbi:hypothetical protein SDC9_200768 [bioreactor metagenome]|uniref:Uncharacterized protein n=1 Tax=bioreactor metagenome TaxID=1076179 RepID=A0A645IXK1_9ZZZZ
MFQIMGQSGGILRLHRRTGIEGDHHLGPRLLGVLRQIHPDAVVQHIDPRRRRISRRFLIRRRRRRRRHRRIRRHHRQTRQQSHHDCIHQLHAPSSSVEPACGPRPTPLSAGIRRASTQNQPY